MDPDPERGAIKPDRNGEIARDKVKRKGKG
jgi:hypothetical protein